MKKSLKLLGNLTFGAMFLILMVFNVHIGNSSNILGINQAHVSEAKAMCPEAQDYCGIAVFPNGIILPEIGEPVTVTP